uniref:Uncharacterized protein n=1 Tax=Triticum urartu TaxID=4572 RepID=A0A8R7PN03_TRIUA
QASGGVGGGELTGACRAAQLPAGAEAGERRCRAAVPALPPARDAGGAVANADARARPVEEEPGLEQPAVVGSRRHRRLRPEHREVRVRAGPGRDRRRRVPDEAPAQVRDDGPTAARGGVGVLAPARLRPVAVEEEAQGVIAGADLERAEGQAGRDVEVGEAHAVGGGRHPAVDDDEGAGAVVDAEDVDGGAAHGSRGVAADAPELEGRVAAGGLRRGPAGRAEPERVLDGEVAARHRLALGGHHMYMAKEEDEQERQADRGRSHESHLDF